MSSDEASSGDDPADRAIESSTPTSPVPFENLSIPQPIDATPPEPARWLAFLGIVVGGLLGGMIGFGVGDLLGGSTNWAAFGAFLGGIGGAIGVGIVAALTLRAMNEWNAVHHPEDPRRQPAARDTPPSNDPS